MTNSISALKVQHPFYNLEGKDNLQEVPSMEAVYGIFALVDEKPVNCRFVGQAENLQTAIKELYANAFDDGLRKFMRGPWMKLLQYTAMPSSSTEERQKVVEQWSQAYAPKVDPDGEYPGYY